MIILKSNKNSNLILTEDNGESNAAEMRRFLVLHKFSVLKHYLASKMNLQSSVNNLSDVFNADNTSIQSDNNSHPNINSIEFFNN